MRRGVDDCVMNACFDAKLLHVSCKNCCKLSWNVHFIANFDLCGLMFAA
jgi:hypothetical protein